MSQKILIIFNPSSGFAYPANYRQDFLNKFKKYLPEAEYQWLNTTISLADQLNDIQLSFFDRIIVIGGDGTIRTVADHLLKNQLDLPIGIIPQGSGNALASSLQIPRKQSSAIKLALKGVGKKIDVGMINERDYFLVGLSFGYISEIINKTSGKIKSRYGSLGYFFTSLKQKHLPRQTFELTADKKVYKISGNSLIIANALSLFRLNTKKRINFHDGQLEIIIFKNKSWLAFLPMAVCFFLFSKKLPFAKTIKAGRIKINFDSSKTSTMQLDGEKTTLPVTEIRVVPQKLTIVSN